MSKLLRLKELLTFTEAKRYAEAFAQEKLPDDDFISALLQTGAQLKFVPSDTWYEFMPESEKNTSTYPPQQAAQWPRKGEPTWLKTCDGYLIPRTGGEFLLDTGQQVAKASPIKLILTNDFDFTAQQSRSEPIYFYERIETGICDPIFNYLTWASLESDHADCLLIPRRSIDTLLEPIYGRLSSTTLTEDKKTRPALQKKEDPRLSRTDLNIIGALLEIISGVTTDNRHPDFSNEADLISFMAEKYNGIQGISKRTLEARFPSARESLNRS